MAAAAQPAGGVPPAALPAGAPPPGVTALRPSVISVPIPPNKPGEPVFQLKLEPDTRLEFKSDKLTEEPCQIEVKLTNPTKDRQTFKVKCTSNDIFRVRPPLGFCDAEATASIKITFSSKTVPESGRHYFAFYHMKNDEKEKTARQVWTPESKFEGVRRIMVYFMTADGTLLPPTAIPTGGVPPVAGAVPAAGAPAQGGAAPPAAGSVPAAAAPPAPAAGGAAPAAAGAAPAAGGAAPAAGKQPAAAK